VDFFVSYACADEAWATWVAEVLEKAGRTVRVQAWDSPAGENFVVWVSTQMDAAGRTLAICSPAYFESHWCTQEWTGALAGRKLIPLRVADCRLPAVLATIGYRDLHGIDQATARRHLLEATGLARPARVGGGFPGTPTPAADGAPFPGGFPAVFQILHRLRHLAGHRSSSNQTRATPAAGGASGAVTAPHGLGGVGEAQSHSRPAAGSRGRRPRIVVALTVLLIVATLLDADGTASRKSRRQTGDVTVAFDWFGLDAESAAADERLPTDLADLVDTSFRSLQSAMASFAEGLDLRILPASGGRATPTKNGSVTARQARLAEVADATGADVVLSGYHRAEVGLTLDFFVSDRRLPDGQLFAGYHVLSTAGSLDIAGNPSSRARAREQLVARGRAFILLFEALGAFAGGDYSTALDMADQLGPMLPDPFERRFVELFRANAFGRLGRLAEAGRGYDAALAVTPGYQRALLGKAEVEYHLAKGVAEGGDDGVACRDGNPDVSRLARVAQEYRRIASLRPADDAYIEEKADFGLARVEICLGFAGEGGWAEASDLLRSVTTAYEGGQRRLRGLAADAYGLLGVVVLATFMDSRAAAHAAIPLYVAAATTATDPRRQATYFDVIGDLRHRLGDDATAARCYAIAGGRDPGSADKYLEKFRELPSVIPEGECR
jgi:tetratricopeptide (TPR) repeat protein